MKRHAKNGNIKLFMQWIFSYVVVLMIPMVACSLIYGVSSDALKKELRQTNQQLVLQIQSKMDSVFDTMFRLAGQIGNNKSLQQLAQEKLDQDTFLGAEKSYQVYQATESLGVVSENNIYNSKFFILFPSASVVMDGQAVNPAETYHK